MKVKTTYYLDDKNEWCVERDGDEYWIRTEKGYQMVTLDLLEALHTALGMLLDKEGKTVTEPLPGGEDRDCSDVAAHAIVKRAEAETQRDELAALLRRLTHNVAHGRIVRCPDRCHAALVRESLVTECAAALAKLEEYDNA